MYGRLIVIDGADGSGKATQTALLYERLLQEGKEIEKLEFPRYTENFFGKLLRECLDGKYGDFISIHPKIVSALYAADRYESAPYITEWLQAGKTVVLDRYVSANMLHQGAKIADEEELEAFLTWLHELEHNVYKIPKPDLVLYLDVPHHIRKELITNDTNRREADLAERHDAHQRATEKVAEKVATLHDTWKTICCHRDGTIRSKEDIHEEIYAHIKEMGI